MAAEATLICGSRNWKLLAHSLADQEEENGVCAQLASHLGTQAHGMGLPISRVGLLKLC